jgi:hypothetical protein
MDWWWLIYMNYLLIACTGIVIIYLLTRIISTAIYVSKWRVRDWWMKSKKSKKEEKNDASRP